MRVFTISRFRDIDSGFKIFSRKAVKKAISLKKYNSHFYMSEICLKIIYMGYLFKEIKVNYYSDFGIWGSEESFSSSIVSNTDELENSSLDMIVNEMLVIMNRVAIIAVALVKKLPADLEDIKLSWETPIPKAPPSDFCKSIIKTKMIAKIMFKVKIIFSITVIYSIFLLYQ